MEATYEHQEIAFFRSMSVHILLGLALFFLVAHERDGSGVAPIELESITRSAPRAKTSATHSNLGASQRHSNRISNLISLDDLGMRLDASAPEGAMNSTVSSNTSEVTDGWDLTNPDPRLGRFNRYVYNAVQGWLDRDAYLNPRVLTGTVKVKIWFDGDGNYLENETVYEAIDPDFQFAVARALRKAFATPIPRPYLFVHQKFSIDRIVVLREF